MLVKMSVQGRREGQSQFDSLPRRAALLAGQHSILQSWAPAFITPTLAPRDAPKAEDAGQRLASRTELKKIS